MNYKVEEPKAHKKIDLDKTIGETFEKYKILKQGQPMIAFGLGGYHDDTFYNKPILHLIERLQLYRKSMTTEVGITPYMYPIYGLSSINEAFLRRVPLNKGKI